MPQSFARCSSSACWSWWLRLACARRAFSPQKISTVDAFPDVTNIQVQVATVAVGRSPEEVERLITVPVEIAMTGLPGLVEMRSMNKSGLSLITLVFTDETDVFFARQLVMERLIEVSPQAAAGHHARARAGIHRSWGGISVHDRAS